MQEPVPSGFDAATAALKVPPHSLEAEQAVLGGLMLDNAAWDRVADLVTEEDFYRRDHRLIYTAIRRLSERDSPFDVVTLAEWLDSNSELDSAGGPAYLASLVNNTPSAANIKSYAGIVRERSVLRQLIAIANEVADGAFNPSGRSVQELLDDAEKKVFEIADQTSRARKGFVAMRDLLVTAVDKIDQLFHRDSPITGVSTGFTDFDEKTSGLQPSDLIIVAGRPSMGKCVVSGTRVLDPRSGRLRTIDEMVAQRDGELAALDERLKVGPRTASHFVDDGQKPVFRVRTRLGREVTTTLTHPFLTVSGWKPLGELAAGDFIGVPRRLPFFGRRLLPEAEVKLLAYFLGDGGTTNASPMFTNGNARIRADFVAAAESLPGIRCVEVRQPQRTTAVRVAKSASDLRAIREQFSRGLKEALARLGWSARQLALTLGVAPASVHYWCSARALPMPDLREPLERVVGPFPPGLKLRFAGGLGGHNAPNAVSGLLRRHGVWDRLAPEKSVPDAIFELERPLLGLFLNRLFACDGSAHLQGEREQPVISYATASERMAQQLLHLLLRFGVVAALRRRQVSYRGERRPFFELRITHRESLRVFIEEIGIFGKEERVEAVRSALCRTRPQSNIDGVPAAVWEQVDAAHAGRAWAEIHAAAGRECPDHLHRSRETVGRGRVAELAALLGDELLAIQADKDVLWDRIESIEPLGLRQVYDLTVPDVHNFVAEDVFVHNTTFAMNMAENAAIRAKVPVAVFSMEMPGEQLAMRMMSSLGRIDQHRVRTGKLDDDDWPRLTSAVGILAETKLFIDDTPALSPTDLRARARRLARECGGLGLIVIDYLQLMQVPGNNENRATQISEISRSLKALAKELHCPVIALSQLNRSLEQRPNKRPVMSDLRESGAIEQDADVIVFIYRDEVYNEDSPDRGTAEIIIGKQRNGPIGTVRLAFLGQYTRFEDLAHGYSGGDYE